MVVDTLGPARRRTYGLCVTVCCSDRYLCTCRIEKECVNYYYYNFIYNCDYNYNYNYSQRAEKR